MGQGIDGQRQCSPYPNQNWDKPSGPKMETAPAQLSLENPPNLLISQ